jgi:dihydroxyacetone kinase-like protein
MDGVFVRRWVDEIAAEVEAQREHLTRLDAAIGDADHGVNLHRGFTAVVAKLATLEPGTAPGPLLRAVGATLISKVGGASGPLYGTLFLQTGKVLGDGRTFEAEDLVKALRAGLDGIRRLGGAVEGDKTMVDAYAPAIEALELQVGAGASLAEAARPASQAAEAGMLATVPWTARKGRASYLGERSAGHQDPGATSTALVFAALERAARSEPLAS